MREGMPWVIYPEEGLFRGEDENLFRKGKIVWKNHNGLYGVSSMGVGGEQIAKGIVLN